MGLFYIKMGVGEVILKEGERMSDLTKGLIYVSLVVFGFNVLLDVVFEPHIRWAWDLIFAMVGAVTYIITVLILL
jgi:hypothetical protein